jgi:hypothetical protein
MVGAHAGSSTGSAQPGNWPGVVRDVNAGADEKIRALEEILQSETFARAGRLRDLLRFLCEAEIDGREGDLSEYAIATLALGRPSDFSPVEDSSVRSRVHELRQKLERYYASEAPDAPVRIELRKGSYAPRFSVFRAHTDDSARPADPVRGAGPGNEVTEPAPRTGHRRIAALGFASGAAAMFAILALWSVWARPGTLLPTTRLQTTAGGAWTPELESLWRPFFARNTPLLIAFETRFFARLGGLMVRDWRVNGPDNMRDSELLMRAQRLFGFDYYANRDYTDAGTPQALFCLTRLLSPRVPAMSLKNSLDLTAADLRDNNVILLGKPGMDAEIERALSTAEIIDLTGGKIVNRHPRAGELAEYDDQSDPANPDRWARKYSVISMIPGSVSGRKILTLTASGSEQPAALAYYVTNADTVRDLVKHLESNNRGVPEFFQVLVRAEYELKSVVKVEYVTHRTLKFH